jgi:hypothetical protein
MVSVRHQGWAARCCLLARLSRVDILLFGLFSSGCCSRSSGKECSCMCIFVKLMGNDPYCIG